MFSLNTVQVISFGHVMTLSEFIRSITFLSHTSIVGNLLYGAVGTYFAMTQMYTILGKTVPYSVTKPNLNTGELERKIEKRQEDGLLQLFSKLRRKLLEDANEDIAGKDVLNGLYGLLNVGLLVTSVPMFFTGLSGGAAVVGRLIGMTSAPQMLAMVVMLTNLMEWIHQYTGTIAIGFSLATIAVFFLNRYASAFHSRSDNNDRRPEDNVVLANSRIFLGFILSVPAVFLFSAAGLGMISKEVLIVGAPLLAFAAAAWLAHCGKGGLQDMGYMLSGSLVLGVLAMIIPATPVNTAIIITLELIASAAAAYQIYQSMADTKGIFHQPQLNYDGLKNMVLDNSFSAGARIATVALPALACHLTGHITAGCLIGTAISMVHTGEWIYQNRDKWVEAKPESTRQYMMIGSVAVFPPLMSASIAMVSQNVGTGLLGVAATTMIAVGTMATVLQTRDL